MLHQHFLERLHNNGERLIPFISHNAEEMRRHFSSYVFFMDVLQHDAELLGRGDFHILEIGFGSGFGSYLLATLDAVARVTAVDISPLCREYAENAYPSQKVTYRVADARTLPEEDIVYDYILSRGVLEHIPDGLSLPFRLRARRRVLINVPYREKEGNTHHCVFHVDKTSFGGLPVSEFFYETLTGRIQESPEGASPVNAIFAVATGDGLPALRAGLDFPRPPASVEHVQTLLASAGPVSVYHETPESLLRAAAADVEPTDVALDVGPGIMPMNFFRPKLHMLLEPCPSYADILRQRHADDKGVLILQAAVLDILPAMADKSVDSIILLDVLEHMSKEEGREVLRHAERLARRQIVIFAPLGFMAQHVPENVKDGFGLDGHDLQEHRSGWLPEDFDPLWKFHICPTFHQQDFRQASLPEPRGAFFAIRTFYERSSAPGDAKEMPDLRPIVPAEVELAETRKLLGQMHSSFARIMRMWTGRAIAEGQPVGGAPEYFTHPLHVGFPGLGDRSAFNGHMRRILDSRWFTNNGVFVQEFERQICQRWGVGHAVAVTNGTLALMLACKALDLHGEVIMPALTFAGTAHALHWQGLKPVFADVDLRTGLLSPAAVEAAITPRTSAILGVHLWGRVCPTDALRAVAKRHGLRLFFDASHAADCSQGATFVGNFGDCECFSLHATNVLHSFEGGLITTSDGELAQRLRLLRNFGICGEDSYEGPGINAKMTEPCAAMGLANLETLDQLTARNRLVHEAYVEGLRQMPGIEVMPYEGTSRANCHSMVIRVLPEFGLSRDMLHVWLTGHNVWARRQYWPGCHRLEPYARECRGSDLPYTDLLCAQCLALPCGAQVVEDYVSQVCALIGQASFPVLAAAR